MRKTLKTSSQIEDWLDHHGISDYTLKIDAKYGFVVDVNNHVDLSHQQLRYIPIQFGKIEGNFHCQGNQLTSLKGSPHIVKGGFYCSRNQIKNLSYSPQRVADYFFCDDNKLTSLVGAPQQLNSNFNCCDNFLTSLQGCPESVGGAFRCDGNLIENLEYCPKKVGRLFFCPRNPKLGEAQDITDFQKIYQLHRAYLDILKEKYNLASKIQSPLTALDSSKNKYKI